MGIVVIAIVAVISFLIGFTCGYDECLKTEIVAMMNKEGDVI